MKDTKVDGFGRYISSSGYVSVGFWKNNNLNGAGMTIMANGDIKDEGIF